MTTRHEFLTEVQKVVAPSVYLEVGVNTGLSLATAADARFAIGVDPAPLVTASGNQEIFKMTSDEYFEKYGGPEHRVIDLAFIDGMHLVEYAMRDFINIERHAWAGTIVIFDDVLPYTDSIANRVQPPGDWTGDVWKVGSFIRAAQYLYAWVDTTPTGTLVVGGLHPGGNPYWNYTTVQESITLAAEDDKPVPESILNRTVAVTPDRALGRIEAWLDYAKRGIGR